MPASSDSSRQYFLGIEGDQLGPFSKQGVIDKIRAGEIPADAMIWWEGLADWRPIEEMEAFRGHFFLKAEDSSPAIPTPEVTRPPQSLRQTLREQSPDSPPPTFAASPSDMKPVFRPQDFEQSDSLFNLNRNWFLGAGGVFLLLVAAGLQFRLSSRAPLVTKRNLAQTNPQLAERQREVAKAASQLFLDPAKNVPLLEKIIADKPGDTAAKEAAEALLDYYRQAKKNAEAGLLLSKLERPGEAAKYFLAVPNAEAAEQAFYSAFQKSTGAERAGYLQQDIQVLLNPLRKRELAVQRIHLFEKTFPGQAHPYGYYLLPTDKKIENIFSRISFSFVQNLVAHMTAEFPQVNLLNRPLVVVKKTTNGQYRIQGSYSGDILLNQDRMSGIGFTFWLIGDQWVLADTNLTRERQRQTASLREKWKGQSQSGAQLLDYLENKFSSQFPGTAPHEPVSLEIKKNRPSPNGSGPTE